MAKYREIRSRIEGIENTAKITQAMKMVAAAKLRRAQDSIIAARPYATKLRELLQFLASNMEVAVSPLLEEREVKRVGIVVIAADRGLVGAFNSNLFKATVQIIQTKYAALNASGNLELICVGNRAISFFRKRGYKIVSTYPSAFLNLDYSLAQRLVTEVSTAFLQHRYDRVDLVYNEFKSVIKQTVAADQFLPIPRVPA